MTVNVDPSGQEKYPGSNEAPSDQASPSGVPLTKGGGLIRDIVSGGVVFLVALPLCLGIALASGTDAMSGLIAGIVGGLVVGAISGSQTSVSGPAAGLTAIVIAQLAALGSFRAFLVAVFLAGILQVIFGVAKAGALSAFFPSSVIKGLLAAIGVILILKQIPHVVGHDNDPEGDWAFWQSDNENTISEIFLTLAGDMHVGALVVGLISIAILVFWMKTPRLRDSLVPSPLIVVVFGVAMKLFFDGMSESWRIEADHLVSVPPTESFAEMASFFTFPDFGALANTKVYIGAITIAIVASLETLLNLEAVDKLDPRRRDSPASRELIAQGVGNMTCGLIGGLPVTSVIVRSSVNVSSGVNSKLSTIFHGFLLVVFVGLFPSILNRIPLSCLAAILLVTGFKLASPKLFKQMWAEGRYQFIPFIVTLLAIIFTDLLIGILIGLAVSVLFILNSNLRRPVRRIVETHLAGDVTRVELANQVSFLNRAALDRIFSDASQGSQMLIDASETDYIDPDVLSLIRDYKEKIAPQRGVTVSLRGFRKKYRLQDDLQFADYSTRELLDQVTPCQVLEILKEGNRRFRSGNRLSRDFNRQVSETAQEQTPLAVVLSCIDSRVPAELVFDLGLGDIFSVRVAGNIFGTKSLASIEYGVGVAKVKLVMVLGHTRCGAVTSAVDLVASGTDVQAATGCEHLGSIVDEISPSIDEDVIAQIANLSEQEQENAVDEVAKRNVQHTINKIISRSSIIQSAVEAGDLRVVGAMYDVKSGGIVFFDA